MKSNSWRIGVALLASGLAAACATTGTGTGNTGRGKAVTFTWNSRGAVSGTMIATLTRTGQAFTGDYFQITSETRVDDLYPLGVGWYRSWDAWPSWYGNMGPDFVTHYSGRVVANLASGDGEHMRCNFRLASPSSGMRGGGQGRCQLPGGKTIDATFPAV